MSLDVTLREFANEFTTDKTYYLLGAIGEKITHTKEFQVYWKSVADSIYNPMNHVTGGHEITRTLGSFIKDGFNLNDTIVIIEGTNTRTGIINIINDTYINYTPITGTAPTTNNFTIYGNTTLTALTYNYNLIENSEISNYNSLIDGNNCTWNATGLTVGGGVVSAVWGSQYNSNFIGSCTVEKIQDASTLNGWKQKFRIIHTFYLTPFVLAGDKENLQGLIPPDYYKGIKSLKYISSIQAKDSLYNPNKTYGGIDDSLKGDTGWFNQHFAGYNPKEYSLQSVIYKDVDDNVLQSIDLTGCKVEIIINSLNNVFSSGNTKFTLNHIFIPTTNAEYSDTITNLEDNFVFDKAINTIGSAVVNGINGIFSNVEATIVNNKMVITAELNFTSAQQNKLTEQTFALWVTTCNYTKQTESSDKMAIYVDSQDYIVSTDNATLLTFNSVKHYEQPFNDIDNPTTGTCDYKGWIVDNVYTTVDFTTNNSTLNKFALKYYVKNINSGAIQLLNQYVLDLLGHPVNTNGIRLVNLDTKIGYLLPKTDIHNKAIISMGTTISTTQQYLCKIASRLRWEDWIKLNYIINSFYDFYNVSLLNNGINQDWYRYDDNVNWELLQVIEISCSDSDGNSTTFQRESVINAHNYNEDGNVIPIWTGSIELFENNTSINNYISAKENTKIVASFDCSPLSVNGALYGVISIEPLNQGGQFGKIEVNSIDAPLSNQLLLPVSSTPSDMIDIIGPSVVTLTAYIDVSKIDKSKQYHIIARLGSACIGSVITEWQEKSSTTTQTIYDFSFVDSNTGYASCNNGIILKTIDGGETWTQCTDMGFPYPMESISFLDSLHGWVAGGSTPYPLIKYTADGGITWTTKTPVQNVNKEFSCIHAFSSSLIMAGADRGLLSYTTDGGTTWTTVTIATNFNIRNLQIISTTIAYAVGEIQGGYGKVYKTIDGGATWNNISIPVINKIYGLYVDGSNIIIGGESGIILKSIDNGITWNQVDGLLTSESLYNFSFNGLNGIVSGSAGSLLSTNDGGDNWAVESISGGALRASYIDANYKLTAGANGKIYKYSQVTQQCDMTVDYYNYLGTENGNILGTEDGNTIILNN